MLFIYLVAAYLIGSIPVGVIVGRLAGFDPRVVGSGNVGMTNVARAGGAIPAAATFIGDLLKGAIPVMIAATAGLPSNQVALVALAAFLGSIFSVFLGFQGGKGVSTSLGIWLALAPQAVLAAMVIFAILLGATRIVSAASIGAAIALPPLVAIFGYGRSYLVLAIVISALVVWRHRSNLARLMNGEEPKLGSRSRNPQHAEG